jgi:hypothetical protein
MADFMIRLLELCLIPFREYDNILVMVPLAALTVALLFGLISRLMYGGKKGG